MTSPAVTVDLSLLERAKTFMEDANRYVAGYESEHESNVALAVYGRGRVLIDEFDGIIAAAKEGGA